MRVSFLHACVATGEYRTHARPHRPSILSQTHLHTQCYDVDNTCLFRILLDFFRVYYFLSLAITQVMQIKRIRRCYCPISDGVSLHVRLRHSLNVDCYSICVRECSDYVFQWHVSLHVAVWSPAFLRFYFLRPGRSFCP